MSRRKISHAGNYDGSIVRFVVQRVVSQANRRAIELKLYVDNSRNARGITRSDILIQVTFFTRFARSSAADAISPRVHSSPARFFEHDAQVSLLAEVAAQTGRTRKSRTANACFANEKSLSPCPAALLYRVGTGGRTREIPRRIHYRVSIVRGSG